MKIVFSLAGGLALFLFGMNGMSDSLQKVAGERMKKVLSFLTKNPIMGVLAGTFVTAVLQSSSATTVMAIGFVSAGLMTLPQAISVIFGANIGTTITAQLIAFKLSNYIHLIVFVGFILHLFSKREKVKDVGMVIFSFGLLFEGIEIMSGATKPLASSAFFTEMMLRVSNVPILGVLLGTAMTAIVQSSSATIAVLQNFASQAGENGLSVIGLTGAVAILLGDNIGTTVTALIASIGQSKDARRTSLAHCVFNLTGSALFLILLHPLCNFVRFISPKGNEVQIIARQIANAHTTFNVVCTLIWLPLIPLMIKIVRFLVRGEDEKEVLPSAPKFLDDKVLNQPLAAITLSAKEIARLIAHEKLLMESLSAIFQAKVSSQQKSLKKQFEYFFQNVKLLKDQIADYITQLFSRGVLTQEQSTKAASLLFCTNNISHISERCYEVENEIKEMQNAGYKFSDDAKNELGECMKTLRRLFAKATQIIFDDEEALALKEIEKDKENLHKFRRKCEKAHLARVEKKKCAKAMTEHYLTILYAIERIGENCVALAEETVDSV